MRYGKKHSAKKVFKFEGLYIAKEDDYLVSYAIKSGYYVVGLHPLTQRFVGIKWEGVYYVYTCLTLGPSTVR